MAKITEQKQLSVADKSHAIEALINYKRQNPAKFEAKKEALFARYGISLDTDIDAPKDETDVLLEKAAKATKKAKSTNE